jgi:membrane protein
LRAFGGRALATLRTYVRRVWLNSAEDDLFFLASGIAFGILLAALPFVLLLVSGVAAVLNYSADESVAHVRRLVDLLLPTHAEGPADPLHSFLDELLRGSRAVSLWSAVGFIWFSTRLFGALRSALGIVFDVETPRTMVAGKLFDIQLTVTFSVLLIAYMFLNVYLTIATTRGILFLTELGIREGVMGTAEYLLGRLIAFAVVILTFYGLYRFLPARRIHDGAAFLGAFVASLLFELARHLYQQLTGAMGPGSVYSGTLYAIASVVFWTYYAAIIFLVGGEVARVHEVRLGAEERLAKYHAEHPELAVSGDAPREPPQGATGAT